MKVPGIHYSSFLSYCKTATYLQCPQGQGVSKMRVTLDRTDGWTMAGSVMGTELHFDPDGSKVEYSKAGIIQYQLVGPFQVEEGLKIVSQKYHQFFENLW